MQWLVPWCCTQRMLLLSATYWSAHEIWHWGRSSPDLPQQGSLMFPSVLPAHLLAPVLLRVLPWALCSVHMLHLLKSQTTHSFNCQVQNGDQQSSSSILSWSLHSCIQHLPLTWISLQPRHAHPVAIYSQPTCCHLFPLLPSSCLCAQNDLCSPESHSHTF